MQYYAKLCKMLCKVMQIYANLCKFMQSKKCAESMTSEIPYVRLALARVDRGAGCDDATETGSRSNGGIRPTGCDNVWSGFIP
jgi:hypothetical protein